MERKKLITLVVVVAVVVGGIGALSAALLGAPPAGPVHVYRVEGDSEWFELPPGGTTGVSALVLDNGAPRFGVGVGVSVNPDTEGLLSAASATTDTLGIARVAYTGYNRTTNVTLTFTFTASIDGQTVTGSTQVKQLAIGVAPTTARAKGLVLRLSDRLPVENATVQVNLLNTTGLPPNAPNFYSANSDAQGRYEVRDIPPRTAFIQIVKSGFQSQRQNLTLVAGKNARVDFLLEQLTGKVLTVWHTYSGKEEDEFRKLVDRFRAARPDLNVVVEFQPFAGAPEKFMVSATAGNAPDVMRFQNDRLGEVAKLGFLEPLDSRMDPQLIARFQAATLDAMRIEGKTYALPVTQDLLAIVYNKDLFARDGLAEPTDDWATDDLAAKARALTKPGQWGFATPQTNAFYWFPWLSAYNPDLITGGSYDSIFAVPDTEPIDGDPDVALNTPEAARSVLLMHRLDKVERVMFANPGENEMLNEFLAGKVAMITTGPWNIPAVERAEINFGIALYPRVSETGNLARPVLGVKGFAIWKLSPVKDDAFDFLKFLSHPDEQKKFSLGVGGVPGTNDIPTAQAALTDPDIQANPIISRYLRQSQQSSKFPSRPQMANVWGPMTDALTFIYQGVDPTSPTAVADAQAILDQEEQEIYA